MPVTKLCMKGDYLVAESDMTLKLVTINGNILSFLYKKSNVGIRPPTSAHKYMQIC